MSVDFLHKVCSQVMPQWSREKIQELVDSQEARERLRENTEEAIRRRVFGVPSMWVTTEKRERLFYGQDRLHLVDKELSEDGQKCALRVISLSAPDISNAKKQKRSLTFYHDFSSPWSFIGSTQIERIAHEAGVSVDYKPILVGAIFKRIGTPLVPAMAVSQEKREYGLTDLLDWADWYSPKIPFRFPSSFPIRSVLALRVSIVEPALTRLLYKAAWIDDLDISDEGVVGRIIKDAGHDEGQTLAKASSQAVKDQLASNTSRAVKDHGLCGVPTCVVRVAAPDGEDQETVLWGQDRFDVVADLLQGWQSSIRVPPVDFFLAQSKL
eukprot:TRINITY_DN1911_c0_g1_i1.p1 TRINITY_DN1911_c0_g1~~TRINITY_DN1911_c0_g1_i1.p1  ORF type:complete len:325 (-),score=79.85 TRINITY_DN1911_c0_g1_i1:94-1068(-)